MSNLYDLHSPDDIINCLDENNRLLIPELNKLDEALIAATERFEGGCPTWEDYLLFLKMLPQLIIVGRYQFQPTTEEEKNFIFSTRVTYSALFEWVDHLVTGSKKPSTGNDSLKKWAKLSEAFLNLAIVLVPRFPELEEKFGTPRNLWFAWECHRFDAAIFECGLITGRGAIRGSKEQVYDGCLDVSAWLKGDLALSSDSQSSDSQTRLLSPWDCLLSCARVTAEKDSTFRDSEAFKEFDNALRRVGLSIRKGAKHHSTFDSGKLLPRGRKANSHMRKKYQGKGFGS
jgi:hypothetical protein